MRLGNRVSPSLKFEQIPSRQQHGPTGRTGSPGKSPHKIGLVENHTVCGQFIQIRGLYGLAHHGVDGTVPMVVGINEQYIGLAGPLPGVLGHASQYL